MERRGKSSPADWELLGHVNSIRSNTVEGLRCERKAGPGRPVEVARAYRQRYVEIDGCQDRTRLIDPCHAKRLQTKGLQPLCTVFGASALPALYPHRLRRSAY